MKENNKQYSKEIFVILFIIILFIIFGINMYINNKANTENTLQQEKYASIVSKKQNEIDDLKEKTSKLKEKTNYNKPYLPEGFNYLEGNWSDGYVIQDDEGNEFVWVPCRVYINDDVLELKRYNFDISENLYVNQCYEDIEVVKDFIESVGKYEGFYIARYEAGKENNKLVSKKNMEVYTNVDFDKAFELSKNMYQKDGITSSLINSLAWDTTLKWIDRTTNSKYSAKGSYTSSYSNVLQKTGYDSINRIYDLSGNANEWTTEKNNEERIYRGEFNNNASNIKRSPGFRSSIKEDSNSNVLGFRVILYAK